MHLLYCDETNFEKKAGDFFVYGGIVIPPQKAVELHGELQALRDKSKVPPGFTLKFNPGPKELSHEQFIALKKAIIAAAVNAECKLLVNLLLHDIATSSDAARRSGVNTLAYHFDCYLARPKDIGLMLIDRFSDKQLDEQLKEKLAVGLTGALPYSSTLKLTRLAGCHLSAIGQSHFCSLVDVLLGSLRFAINCFTQKNAQHVKSAEAILEQLAPLFFREGGPFQDATKVHEISLWFSPKTVRSGKYRSQYAALRDYLAKHGVHAAQPI